MKCLQICLPSPHLMDSSDLHGRQDGSSARQVVEMLQETFPTFFKMGKRSFIVRQCRINLLLTLQNALNYWGCIFTFTLSPSLNSKGCLFWSGHFFVLLVAFATLALSCQFFTNRQAIGLRLVQLLATGCGAKGGCPVANLNGLCK